MDTLHDLYKLVSNKYIRYLPQLLYHNIDQFLLDQSKAQSDIFFNQTYNYHSYSPSSYALSLDRIPYEVETDILLALVNHIELSMEL